MVINIYTKVSKKAKRKKGQKRGQVRLWLFRSSSSISRALWAILVSAPALAFIPKQAELTEEVFSNPKTLYKFAPKTGA